MLSTLETRTAQIIDLQNPTTLDFYGATQKSDGTLYVTGDGGIIYELNQGTWQEVFRPSNPSPGYVMYTTPGDEVWAFIWNLAQYHQNGSRWDRVFNLASMFVLDACFLGDDEFWGAGINGTVLHYDSGNWDIEPRLGFTFLRAIDTDPQGNLWVAGHHGAFFTKQAGSWHQITMDENISIAGLLALNQDEVYLCGWWGLTEGRLLKYDGSTLHDLTPPGCQPLYRIRRGPADTLWVVGISGQVYRHHQTQWEVVEAGRRESLYEVIPQSEDSAIVVGSEAAVWLLEVQNETPTPIPTATPVQVSPTPTPMPTVTPTPLERPRILAAGFGRSGPGSDNGYIELMVLTEGPVIALDLLIDAYHVITLLDEVPGGMKYWYWSYDFGPLPYPEVRFPSVIHFHDLQGQLHFDAWPFLTVLNP